MVKAFLLACMVLCATSVRAATYYVAASGGLDSRSCATSQTITTPKLTIGSGAACLTPGDTLLVRTGTYNEAINNSIPGGTSWANKVRVAAYPGEVVLLRPTAVSDYAVYLNQSSRVYIEIDGINISSPNAAAGAVKIEETAGNLPHHIRLQNLEINANPSAPSQGVVIDSQTDTAIGHNELINLTIHNVGGDDFCHGVYIKSPNNLVENSDIYDAPGAAIQIYNTAHPVTGNIIRNNKLHGGRLTAAGQRHWGIINADGASNSQIYNNLFYDIPSEGGSSVALYIYAGDAVWAYNNTVYGNSGEGVAVEIYATNARVQNNISYLNSGGNYSLRGTVTAHSFNLEGVNPTFVNAATKDFHLVAGSLAIDAGTTIATVTTDKDGNVRPMGDAYDIGAYESGGTGGFTVSASCTIVPGSGSITDAGGALWTLGTGVTPVIQILRNGSQAAGAFGAQILWYLLVLYVQGDDLNWYEWDGTSFNAVGSAKPSGTACDPAIPAAGAGLGYRWWVRF